MTPTDVGFLDMGPDGIENIPSRSIPRLSFANQVPDIVVEPVNPRIGMAPIITQSFLFKWPHQGPDFR